MWGDHPEDAAVSSTLISRAFVPPCIPAHHQDDARTASLGPDVCRTDRNPRRTLVFMCANSVPIIPRPAADVYFQFNQCLRPWTKSASLANHGRIPYLRTASAHAA